MVVHQHRQLRRSGGGAVGWYRRVALVAPRRRRHAIEAHDIVLQAKGIAIDDHGGARCRRQSLIRR